MRHEENRGNGDPMDPAARRMNRTGISVAMDRAREMYDGAKSAAPSEEGDEYAIHDIRLEYQREAAKLGSRPRPRVLRDPAQPGMKVLLDKLGERIAFERRGVRLYDAVVHRWQGTPGLQRNALDALRTIREQELEHFLYLQTVILDLGGDPTTVTPSADVVQVISKGVRDVVVDPRTTPAHWLQAILTAELSDTDGWLLLANIAAALGLDEESERFRRAQAEEDRHVKVVRGMLEALTLQEASESEAPI
jgi:hypothetical protein